jgi:hypothetical protein
MAQVQDVEIEQAGRHATVRAAVDEAFEKPDGVSMITFLVPDAERAFPFDDDELFDVVTAGGRRSRFVVVRKVGRQRLAVR